MGVDGVVLGFHSRVSSCQIAALLGSSSLLLSATHVRTQNRDRRRTGPEELSDQRVPSSELSHNLDHLLSNSGRSTGMATIPRRRVLEAMYPDFFQFLRKEEAKVSSDRAPIPGTFFPRAPMRPKALVESISPSGAAELMVGQNGDRAEVVLNFDHQTSLGAQVRLFLEGVGLIAEFFPEEWSTYRQLRAEEQGLRKRFEDRGLVVSRIVVHEPG